MTQIGRSGNQNVQRKSRAVGVASNNVSSFGGAIVKKYLMFQLAVLL